MGLILLALLIAAPICLAGRSTGRRWLVICGVSLVVVVALAALLSTTHTEAKVSDGAPRGEFRPEPLRV